MSDTLFEAVHPLPGDDGEARVGLTVAEPPLQRAGLQLVFRAWAAHRSTNRAVVLDVDAARGVAWALLHGPTVPVWAGHKPVGVIVTRQEGGGCEVRPTIYITPLPFPELLLSLTGGEASELAQALLSWAGPLLPVESRAQMTRRHAREMTDAVRDEGGGAARGDGAKKVPSALPAWRYGAGATRARLGRTAAVGGNFAVVTRDPRRRGEDAELHVDVWRGGTDLDDPATYRSEGLDGRYRGYGVDLSAGDVEVLRKMLPPPRDAPVPVVAPTEVKRLHAREVADVTDLSCVQGGRVVVHAWPTGDPRAAVFVGDGVDQRCVGTLGEGHVEALVEYLTAGPDFGSGRAFAMVAADGSRSAWSARLRGGWLLRSSGSQVVLSVGDGRRVAAALQGAPEPGASSGDDVAESERGRAVSPHDLDLGWGSVTFGQDEGAPFATFSVGDPRVDVGVLSVVESGARLVRVLRREVPSLVFLLGAVNAGGIRPWPFEYGGGVWRFGGRAGAARVLTGGEVTSIADAVEAAVRRVRPESDADDGAVADLPDGGVDPTAEQVEAFQAGWEAADRRGEKGARTIAGLRAVFALEDPEVVMSPGYERRARALLDARVAVGPAPSSDASGVFQSSALRGWRSEVQALAEWSLKGPDLADHAGELADQLDKARAAGHASGVDDAQRKASAAVVDARQQGYEAGEAEGRSWTAQRDLDDGTAGDALKASARGFVARERKAKKGSQATGGEG